MVNSTFGARFPWSRSSICLNFLDVLQRRVKETNQTKKPKPEDFVLTEYCLEHTIGYLEHWLKYPCGDPNQLYEACTVQMCVEGTYLQHTNTTRLSVQVLSIQRLSRCAKLFINCVARTPGTWCILEALESLCTHCAVSFCMCHMANISQLLIGVRSHGIHAVGWTPQSNTVSSWIINLRWEYGTLSQNHMDVPFLDIKYSYKKKWKTKAVLKSKLFLLNRDVISFFQAYCSDEVPRHRLCNLCLQTHTLRINLYNRCCKSPGIFYGVNKKLSWFSPRSTPL